MKWVEKSYLIRKVGSAFVTVGVVPSLFFEVLLPVLGSPFHLLMYKVRGRYFIPITNGIFCYLVSIPNGWLLLLLVMMEEL